MPGADGELESRWPGQAQNTCSRWQEADHIKNLFGEVRKTTIGVFIAMVMKRWF
jgi:hypothetical protein